MVTKRDFNGYTLFTITEGDFSASVTDLGATAVSIRFDGREMILGYDNADDYLSKGGKLGATCGRYANRIGGAAFTLDGVEYRLTANEGKNILHSGPNAFDKQRWGSEVLENGVRFSLVSPDGENGFPGNLRAVVTYTVKGTTLRIDFEGETDRDTVYAPTNHMYFTLGGSGSVLDAELYVNASRYLAVDEGLIPTEQTPVADTAFDFRKLRRVEQDYDHCFVLDGEPACTMKRGGVGMDLVTDLPALQVYTGLHLKAPFEKNEGLALEPESFLDSPNRPDFPDTTLRVGEHYHRWAEYRFFQA